MSYDTNDSAKGPQAATSSSSLSLPRNLDPALVHEILLTDPWDFDKLTLSSQQQPTTTTQTYDEFTAALQVHSQHSSSSTTTTAPPTVHHDIQTIIAMTMKAAYCQQVVQHVMSSLTSSSSSSSLHSLQQLYQELQTAIQQLVPHRPDIQQSLVTNLHHPTTPSTSAFNDSIEATLIQFRQSVLHAAQTLEQLESPARATSTQHWLQLAQRKTFRDKELSEVRDFVQFLVTSLLYLLYKAELCQYDKQQFYLVHVWAPQLYANHQQLGIQLERHAFLQRYTSQKKGKEQTNGPTTIDSVEFRNAAPHTVQWLQQIVTKNSDSSDRDSRSCRQHFLQAWIIDLLFRPSDHGSIALPEIFALFDQAAFAQIRQTTRLIATASTILLYIKQLSKVSSTKPSRVETDASLHEKRIAILQALLELPLQESRTEWESNLCAMVQSLAKQDSSMPLSEQDQITLNNQILRVVRGQDSVIQVLVNRIKETFAELVVVYSNETTTGHTTERTALPSQIRTGIAAPPQSKMTKNNWTWQEAVDLFCKRGLVEYANDLAETARMACKIAALAWKVYGDGLLAGFVY